MLAGLVAVAACLVSPATAVELKLADGTRVAALIDSFDGKDSVTIFLTSGEKRTVSLRDISAIYFSGRTEHFIRTGDQKFIFAAGGNICGAVEDLKNGDTMEILSQSLGRHVVPVKFLHGFTAMSVEGRPARLADDLMREDGVVLTAENNFLDFVLDRRGVPYAGVVESFTPLRLEFEHDEQLQAVRIDTFKLAGVRLAEASKDKSKISESLDLLQIGIRCRDRSYLVGQIVSINPFQWTIQPAFDPKRQIGVPTSEIVKADILGGRSVFLATLRPLKVEETTVVAPPQPYQKNSNSQGENMDIGGFIYQNGIGVHGKSKLTFRLEGKFKVFYADVGIDGRLEKEGSVIFQVLGDGRELFKSPLVRGKPAGGGLAVQVPVEGVKELTLVVDPTDDLDQADVANWGAVRVLR